MALKIRISLYLTFNAKSSQISDFLHLLEDGAKLKITSEVTPTFTEWCNDQQEICFLFSLIDAIEGCVEFYLWVVVNSFRKEKAPVKPVLFKRATFKF